MLYKNTRGEKLASSNPELTSLLSEKYFLNLSDAKRLLVDETKGKRKIIKRLIIVHTCG